MSLLYGTAGDDILTPDNRDTGYFFGLGGNDTFVVPGSYFDSTLSFGYEFDEDGTFFNTVRVIYPSTDQAGNDSRYLYSVENIKFTDGIIKFNFEDVLFDPIYYYYLNPDVYAAGFDASDHYRDFGWREGRDPNYFFDTSGYLAAYNDVAASGLNPLEHYRNFGASEGREVNTRGSLNGYLKLNPDLSAAGVEPLAHILGFGGIEDRPFATDFIGRNIDADGFDATFYLWKNFDVAQSGIGAREHYFSFGYLEGRAPNDFFIPELYLENNPDVAAAGIEPLTHYDQFGADEDRSTGVPKLDNYYERRPDVAAAGINPLKHFLEFGYYEDFVLNS